MMLPTLLKLMMLNKLLARLRLARLPVSARDSARFRRKRADLCMITSSALGAFSLTLPRRGSLTALSTVAVALTGGIARQPQVLYHPCPI
jgi:hypothetical protein